jgi:Phosphotransferase enzyme family
VNVREADLRFVLPEPPRSVTLLDASAETSNAWRACGVDVGTTWDGQRADLVVARASRLGEAVERQPAMLVVYGRVLRRRLAAAGYRSAYLLALPSPGAPRLVVPLYSRPALAAALTAVGRRPLSRASLRRALSLVLLQFRLAPSGAVVTVAARQSTRPWFLEEVGRHVEVSSSVPWFLWLGSGDPLQRALLHVVKPNGGWALKFSRIPANDEPFQREERAAHAAQQLPTTVARRMPRLLARGTNHGLPFLLETRFAGRSLHEALQSNWPITRRLEYVEVVVRWLRDLAVATRTPPDSLASERTRLSDVVGPAWANRANIAAALAAVQNVPGVLAHNDVGTWNIVVDARGGFGVVDWESSRQPGMPLWDLAYFLADALTLVELGQTRDRTQDILRLFRGESSYSAALFRHLRAATADLAIEPQAVGPLITFGWLHHGLSSGQRQERLRGVGADPVLDHGGLLSEVAMPWLRDSQLGFSWRPWP